MKKRNPSGGQNGQLVHWWVLIHSGPKLGLQRGSLPKEEPHNIGSMSKKSANKVSYIYLLNFYKLLFLLPKWMLEKKKRC
jgi:hypothetical protein